jgi:UDP-N-acetylglucosamine/UDP-N-acetyl-alpha-D-glucosaminouronate 4-epimerase
MRVLVTGAAGFIGSHLCRGVAAEGHEVVGLDDLSDGTLDNFVDASEVRFENGDVRDAGAVLAAARGCSAILHHAAMKSVERSVREPRAFDDVNVRGTLNVLEAAREVEARVVFASSSSVYGDQDRFPVTEDMEPRPRSPYAATKLAAEAYCRAWWLSFGVPTISLRYFNVYGPGQDPASEYAAVIPRFIVACLTDGRPTIHGDGEQSRDFTYIDDVVDANVRAVAPPDHALGRVFNIAGGRPPVSVKRLLTLIARLTGCDPDPLHERAREGDIRRSEADVSAARSAIGYDPKIDIEEGLRRTVASFSATIDR